MAVVGRMMWYFNFKNNLFHFLFSFSEENNFSFSSNLS